MSTIDTIDVARPAWPVTVARRILAWLGDFDLRVERYRSRIDLMELTEHQLRDIGLTREEAVREATRPFWG